MTWLDDRIAAGEIVTLDGAMGTEFERRGVVMDDGAWCARALLSDPDKVRELHLDYIDAGAELVIRYIKTVAPTLKTATDRIRHLERWKSELSHLVLANATPSVIAEVRDKLLAEPTVRGNNGNPTAVQREDTLRGDLRTDWSGTGVGGYIRRLERKPHARIF